jgi:radical SAM superfamily enzyme YgiQ (UPF0313 family)
MKKNILLVNPWIYDFAAYDFWFKPLGLLYIASLLRHNGYHVNLIDCVNPFHPLLKEEPKIKWPLKRSSGRGRFPKEAISKPPQLRGIQRIYGRYGITPRIFHEELNSLKEPDVIFVTSMMTYWYPGVFEVIRILKERFPGVPVALGGNYVTLCPDHAVLSGADFTIPGEGEGIAELLKDLFDDVFLFPDAGDLDAFPYPAFDLLPYFDQVAILTSKGCPYRCTYCASHLLNRDFTRRDPVKVVDEITFWNRHFGIRHFSFFDDALLVDAEKGAIPMLEEIIRRQLDCEFHCPNGLHLSEITGNLSRLMRAAGFKTIRFGFESSDPVRQIDTGGKVNNDHLKNAIRHLKGAGYRAQEIGIYVLCGLPGQEASEVSETIRYVQECGARPFISEYSPIPNTMLWEASITMSPFDLRGEPLFHNNSLLPCRSEKLSFEMYQELKLMTKNVHFM